MLQKHTTQLIAEPNYIYRVGASVLVAAIKNLDKKEMSELFSILGNTLFI
jgi:hypothetical protein